MYLSFKTNQQEKNILVKKKLIFENWEGNIYNFE